MNDERRVSTVNIEVSGRCQARCPYCLRYRMPRRHSGELISVELFEAILDHLLDVGLLDPELSGVVSLFSWGEPLLHPRINDLLRCLKKRRLRACLSSNFITLPHLEPDLLPVMMNVVFSLAGFTQRSCERIHGHPLHVVLNNFERFYHHLRAHSPATRIMVCWHRYRFNEGELWPAYRYFHRPQVCFRDQTAFLDDVIEMLDLVSCDRPAIPASRMGDVQRDLFVEHILDVIHRQRPKSRGHRCFKWNELTIDEKGQLLVCTGISNIDTDHVLGSVLDLSANQIWERKLRDPLCDACISTGLCRFLDLPQLSQLPLPPGGGLDFLKLHAVRRLILAKCHATQGLRRSKAGGAVLEYLKHLRRRWKLHYLGMHPL